MGFVMGNHKLTAKARGFRRRRWLLAVAPFVVSICSACSNIFSEVANKKSDEALLFQAQMLADQRDWSGAIAAVELMTPAGKDKREAKVFLSSAYAGRCGLNLIGLAKSVADGTASGGTLMPVLLSAFQTASVAQVADCKLAEQTLTSIGTGAALNADENVLLAFISFAKIGAVLAATGVDGDGNGTVDGSFDSCVNNASNIQDADVRELGTGITLALGALTASGASVGGDATTAISAMCGSIDGLLGTTGFCTQYSASDFDNSEVLGLRALIKSNEIGFNSCGGAVGTGTCFCL